MERPFCRTCKFLQEQRKGAVWRLSGTALFHQAVEPEQSKDAKRDLTDQKTGQVTSDTDNRDQKYNKKDTDQAGEKV